MKNALKVNNFIVSHAGFMRSFVLFSFLLMMYLPGYGYVYQESIQQRLQDQIYQSFVFGDISKWQSTLEEMERYFGSHPSADQLYDLLLARYGYIAFLLEDNSSVARRQLEKAEQELERLSRFPRYAAHTHAFRAAFYGFRITLRPLSAIRLGPRSYAAVDEALQTDPSNPLGWMEKGNTRFYTPSTFGGSKQEALEAYAQAISLFEQNMIPNHRWIYLNSLIGLAKSYQYTGNRALAIATYRKALTFEPEFKWVRDDLLPELLRN